ncbi:MAG: (Fe-S)-binding protein [Archaeoglobaceae archaeon]|nr:(Fe-S)-binding protein [Archaeoglobaceae archaeon]
MKEEIKISDISKKDEMLVKLSSEDLMKLPKPYDEISVKLGEPIINKGYVSDLDGFVAIDLEWKPKDEEEERELILKFRNGVKKLLDKEANWTFLYPLLLSLNYCTRCKSCSLACHVYLGSGKKEIYRPTYRSEVFRRVVNSQKGKLRAKFFGSIEINSKLVLRLAELAYRCNLCRRCAQFCPIGVDNGLIAREIRKLFAQELGIAPKALHSQGSIKQLQNGSSTGLTPEGFKDMIRFIEEEILEKTGKRIKIPVDKKGSEILLIHNAGDYLSRLENVMAYALIFEEAGIDWTLSGEALGYDVVNYGVWFDDLQLARIALRHVEVAKKLEVEKIVVGECGHAHKALLAVSDRIIPEEYRIPRESCIPLLWEIVRKNLDLDPSKNDFPVTLHDPCNIVRNLGIVEPQRKILQKICPQFREMEPNGFYNYCCGGGGGLAVINSLNFPEFKKTVSGRVKFSQILNSFQDVPPHERKFVCAPCSNCRSMLRDLFAFYKAGEKCRIHECGLAELIANAMLDAKMSFFNSKY